MRMRSAALAPLAVGAALVLAACSGSASGDATPAASPSGSASAQAVIAEADAMPLVSTLNGTVPPGKPTLVHTSTEILTLMRNGEQVRVYRDIREPGTRAPIHVHPFGGWTCVVSGQAVLYMEGAKPERANAGDCVDMPPLRAMSNVNPGPGPSVLLDNFATPPGAPIWRIVEQGQTQLGNEFASGDTTRTNNP